MRVLKLLLILLFSINSLITLSQETDCEKILDKELKIKEKNINQTDLNILKECGYDFEKYSRNSMFFAITDIASKGEKLTYRKLFSRLNEMDSKLKSQYKDQIVILIFKFCVLVLILVTLFYWIYHFFKNKKALNKE